MRFGVPPVQFLQPLRKPLLNALIEPFTNCYYFSQERRNNRYGSYNSLDDYTSQKAIQSMISQNSKSITFVKDLAFQAFYYLDEKFLDHITNSLMILSPRKVISSLSTPT